MKTVMMLCALALFACNDKSQIKRDDKAIDNQTRTTSAVIVEPTLHDSHAAEPEQSGAQDQSVDHNEEMDVDEAEMNGTARDGGVVNGVPNY